jgi:hypothetical protein
MIGSTHDFLRLSRIGFELKNSLQQQSSVHKKKRALTMSRFWAAGGSSSESESDDDSYTSSGSSQGARQNENKWADLSDDSGE